MMLSVLDWQEANIRQAREHPARQAPRAVTLRDCHFRESGTV
jgi:hypothetical protein